MSEVPKLILLSGGHFGPDDYERDPMWPSWHDTQKSEPRPRLMTSQIIDILSGNAKPTQGDSE